MTIRVIEQPIAALPQYARIPIAFEVNRILEMRVSPHSPGQFILSERRVDPPYLKDYDAIDGEGPMWWAKHFDLSNWGFFAAYADGRHVGGAAVAFNTPGLALLEDRTDWAVLWDIRIRPEARRQGVGGALLQAAIAWSLAKNCRRLKVETQNINVPACRFYEHNDFVLGAINRSAYPQFPNEIQMLWHKNISAMTV